MSGRRPARPRATPLPAEVVKLVEEMVSWNMRIKDIENIVPHLVRRALANGPDPQLGERAGKLARQHYDRQGLRPPSGSVVSAQTLRWPDSHARTVASLLSLFQQATRSGQSAQRAMVTVYRIYWNQRSGDPDDFQADLSVSSWVALAREVCTGAARLADCPQCRGRTLVHRQQGHGRPCVWCAAQSTRNAGPGPQAHP